MKDALRMLLSTCVICAATAQAQELAQGQREIDAKLDASRKVLREAMVNLRDVRLTSCRSGQVADCELANLSEIELALLDVEAKYQ